MHTAPGPRRSRNFGVGSGPDGKLQTFDGRRPRANGVYLFGAQRLWFRNPGRDNSGVSGFYQFGPTTPTCWRPPVFRHRPTASASSGRPTTRSRAWVDWLNTRSAPAASSARPTRISGDSGEPAHAIHLLSMKLFGRLVPQRTSPISRPPRERIHPRALASPPADGPF